jgi:flagellar biosynthesis anti-sigma factor FlgM
MRINLGQGSQPVNESSVNFSQRGGSGAGANSGTAIGEDQTQLSGAHLQVAALAAQAAALPEVRQERVQALRQAMQSGQYHADPQKLAGALMSHMRAGAA